MILCCIVEEGIDGHKRISYTCYSFNKENNDHG